MCFCIYIMQARDQLQRRLARMRLPRYSFHVGVDHFTRCDDLPHSIVAATAFAKKLQPGGWNTRILADPSKENLMSCFTQHLVTTLNPTEADRCRMALFSFSTHGQQRNGNLLMHMSDGHTVELNELVSKVAALDCSAGLQRHRCLCANIFIVDCCRVTVDTQPPNIRDASNCFIMYAAGTGKFGWGGGVTVDGQNYPVLHGAL